MKTPQTRIPATVFLLVALVATVTYSPAAPAAELERVIRDTELRADSQFAKDNIGSLTVGIVADGKLVWTKSYGMADMEKRIPATRETIYRIASITKQFTALMLLQLAESGAIELSDPVAGYFPELGAVQGHMSRSSPTTLFQLATHTSGLDREPDGDAFDSGPVGDWEKVLIAAMPHTHYIREPGTEFYYSNIGYAVLGAALSRAAREPYTRYLHAHVFDPLKMNNTSFELDDRNSSRLAKGYMVSGAVIDSLAPRTQLNGRGFRVPSGGLFTTVDDLAKFMSFEMQLDSNSVLMKKNFEASLHRLIVMTDADHGYGAGFMLARLGSSIAFGHDGNMDGYQAQAFFVRKSRLGVIVLASSSGGKLDTSDIVRGALQNR